MTYCFYTKIYNLINFRTKIIFTSDIIITGISA